MEMVRRLKICNSLGLHARAAAKIVELADRYESKLFLAKDWTSGGRVQYPFNPHAGLPKRYGDGSSHNRERF